MKFVSPFQRGSTCTCTWPGHAGAGGPADVHADVDRRPGEYAPSSAAVAPLGRRHERRRPRRRRGPASVGLVPQRRDHEVARRVGVHVHHRERRRRALEDERLVVGSAALRARRTGSRGRRSAAPRRDALDVLGAPARPEALEASSRDASRARRPRRRGARRSRRPRRRARAASLPRAFTPTVPSSASSSPTTSTYGTFSSLARRTRVAEACRCARRASRPGSPRPAGGRRRRNAYASWRSATGSTVTCTGASHGGNAPA